MCTLVTDYIIYYNPYSLAIVLLLVTLITDIKNFTAQKLKGHIHLLHIYMYSFYIIKNNIYK